MVSVLSTGVKGMEQCRAVGKWLKPKAENMLCIWISKDRKLHDAFFVYTSWRKCQL